MRLRELVKMNRSLRQGGRVWSEVVDGLSANTGHGPRGSAVQRARQGSVPNRLNAAAAGRSHGALTVTTRKKLRIWSCCQPHSQQRTEVWFRLFVLEASLGFVASVRCVISE